MLPGYSVLGGLITFEIWTHLSLYFSVVSVRVWGFLEVGLSTDSSPRKRCRLARHPLIARTVQIWPHIPQNISGVCIDRTQRCKQTWYRLLRRRLWGVRFFPSAVFPTISQTLAAEALAISIEAPMGNARDAAEERRLRRKGEKAKVRAPRRRPSTWRRRKKRPWESILDCSVVKEAISNQFQGKPVQFPGALGLDIPFSSLYTAQIREEHAYCRSQQPICLLDPCRLGLFLAYYANLSSCSNFPWIRKPRWPRWEIASYL